MAEEVTLRMLLTRMEAAHYRMSAKNPTKRLLAIAAQVLIKQAEELVGYRAKEAQGRIVIP